MGISVYVSQQCPNCDRLCKIIKRLKIPGMVIVPVDGKRIEGLTAVPTIVDGTHIMVGTKAFEWIQQYESTVPLDTYATVLGEGAGGLSYTDLESDETVDATPFTFL